jgi:hypothetical protein
VAVDARGRVYVADTFNDRIQVFDNTGAYLTAIGGDWGTNTGQFRRPHAVDVDSASNVYVADRYNHRIQKFAPGVPGWRQVNINGFGERQNECVSALDVFNGQMYAGTWAGLGQQAQVWHTADGQTWNQCTPSWPASNVAVLDTQAFGPYLYVGTGNQESGGEVWRTDGIAWTQVVSGGFSDVNNGIDAFAVLSGAIYAATDNSVTGVEVWRSTTGDVSS